MSDPLPPRQKAIIQGPGGTPIVVPNAPVPSIEPGMVLVKTVAVALNPTDVKMPVNFPSPGATVGCDFSGVVVRVGSDAATNRPASPLKVGDRVCGAVHGSNPVDHQSGSFAEYVRAAADLVLKVPDSMPFEDAAALGGVGHGTMGIALWDCLGLPASPDRPAEKPIHVLVYGGSTSTGTMAIQLLKLSGLIPITTCSPKNFALVKSFGAAAAFSYSSPSCAADIKTYTKNTLRYALDCITNVDSIALCHAAIGRAGGRYTCLEACPDALQTRKAVKTEFLMGYDIYGKGIALERGYEREPNPERNRRGVAWFQSMQGLLDRGRVRTHPVLVLRGGLEGVLKGLEKLRSGAVSGQKLVVRIG